MSLYLLGATPSKRRASFPEPFPFRDKRQPGAPSHLEELGAPPMQYTRINLRNMTTSDKVWFHEVAEL
eukprot:712312-Prymnesium_polylepis.1